MFGVFLNEVLLWVGKNARHMNVIRKDIFLEKNVHEHRKYCSSIEYATIYSFNYDLFNSTKNLVPLIRIFGVFHDLSIDIRKGNGLATLFNTIHDLRFSYFE